MNRNPVVVDMFCGSGGESQGIEWAAEKAGIDIKLYAINHWQRAIETHQTNFPDAEHICRQVQDIDPSSIVPGGKVPLMWASPECTHFSVARGGKPCNDQSRVTPFTILDWLNKLIVDRLIIENVSEFQQWGPLDPVTRRPIKERKGEIFNAFITMIRGLGYEIDWKVLNAADYGAPTTRRRLIIQAVRSGSDKTILWPQATHIPPGSSAVSALPHWVPARKIIDWSLPTQIIDERTRPLAPNTMKRIFRGIEKYWGEYATPFLMHYNKEEDPIHSNHCGLVQPLIMCIGQTSSKNRTRSINEPLATVVTKEEACLIEPLFIPQHSCGQVRPTTGPLSTITTSGAIGLVEPLIMNYYGTGICHPVSESIPTVTCKDRFALITPENIRLGFRMLKAHELAAAQSFPQDYIFTGNRADVIRQIGNAVCPKLAEALTSNYMKELAGSLAGA